MASEGRRRASGDHSVVKGKDDSAQEDVSFVVSFVGEIVRLETCVVRGFCGAAPAVPKFLHFAKLLFEKMCSWALLFLHGPLVEQCWLVAAQNGPLVVVL